MSGEELFFHPAVRSVIRAVLLSKGIRDENDLEDGIQTVMLQCIVQVRRTGRPPTDGDEAKAIARPIAQNLGVDDIRKRVRRGKVVQPMPGDADDHPREPERAVDPVDQQRILDLAAQALTKQEMEALTDVGAGVPHAQLAADAGVSPATNRKRTEASRKRVRSSLGPYWTTGGLAALLASMVALYIWREPGDVAKSPMAYAAEQRHLAADSCKARSWDDCEKALDRAAQADPEGDLGPEVKALRDAIAAGRRGTGTGDGATR